MPYDSTKDLPDNVRDALPDHAEHIYREAFNSAAKEYGDETTAHKVAWSAVKKEYEKGPHGWVRKKR